MLSIKTLGLVTTRRLRISQRSLSSLVVADHNNETITPITYNTIGAAKKIGDGTIDVLLITNNPDKLVPQLQKVQHVNKVLVARHDAFDQLLAERMSPAIVHVHKKTPYTHILGGTNFFGTSLLPRVAAALDVGGAITGVIDIVDPDRFRRPIYGGQVIETRKSKAPVKILTIRATAFPKVETEGGSATVEEVEVPAEEIERRANRSKVVKPLEIKQGGRPDLTAAKVVVSGGRGVKNKDNFDLIYKLADKLGAAVGASRAAVDAGFAPNELQVGQTGKIIAPDLYVAVGISGAIQHLSGMKDSKTIMAINSDPEAPIFQIADICLEADLFKAVPEMLEKIDGFKKK